MTMKNHNKPKHIEKDRSEQLAIQDVGSSAMTNDDLIAFAKWVDDKFYTHRLKIMPKDLTEFYFKNRASILKQYL